jgi:hypothetical protein
MVFVRQEIRVAENRAAKTSRWLRIFVALHATVLLTAIFATLNDLWISPNQISDYRSGSWTARFVPIQIGLLAVVLGLLVLDAVVTLIMWRRCAILSEPLSWRTYGIAATLEFKPLDMGALALVTAGMLSDSVAIVRLFDLVLCVIAWFGASLTRRSMNQPVVLDFLHAQVKCENGN